MDRYQYLVLMAACLAITLPLEFLFRARVYRRWRLLVRALVPVLVVFAFWDIVGIVRGHWWYSERYTTGVMLGPMPLEELVFFIVIPICGVLTYEAVGTVLGWVRGHGPTLIDGRPGRSRPRPGRRQNHEGQQAAAGERPHA
ncbi:MAG TPA: lycopene cyclase domain-containing protein [Dermatophilaceae bacterium]|nr:lycopene cyclase domain-containing protein [Dermatophilaceae bacterium]